MRPPVRPAGATLRPVTLPVIPWSSPAATAVENRLFRALAVLRVVVLLNSVALNVYRADHLHRPALGAACVAVMVLWTGFALWAYVEPARRTAQLLVTDLALAVALLLATPLAKGEAFRATIPGFWILGALFAWSIHYRLMGGLIAGALLATVDLALRQRIEQSDYGNAFLLVIGGPIVGFMCESLQRMATERDAAERVAAVAAERARLARAVHDGVLQVLALVQRRAGDQSSDQPPDQPSDQPSGPSVGLAELGRLAAEQEVKLRALIRAQDVVAATTPEGSVDLAAELARLERSGAVTVSAPGFPVELPTAVADELVAATRACLDNVRLHVGADAQAWVLLQAFPDRVELSVRDDGPGIPAGRLEEAVTQGRLGVSESIRGRIAELGGTAELVTGSFGTEWDLVVPRTTVSAESAP